MPNRLLLFLPFFLAFLGCSKPVSQSPTTERGPVALPKQKLPETCPENFYYSDNEKIPLQINPQIMLAGFANENAAAEHQQILKRFPEISEIGNAQRSASGIFYILKLHPETTCVQALAFARNLQTLPEITFANPAFRAPTHLGNDLAWIGITSEFLVTLKSAAEMEKFKTGLAQTQTTILDSLGQSVFIVQASKNAKGNALQMANYFHEQPYVQLAEPDFYLANSISQGVKP